MISKITSGIFCTFYALKNWRIYGITQHIPTQFCKPSFKNSPININARKHRTVPHQTIPNQRMLISNPKTPSQLNVASWCPLKLEKNKGPECKPNFPMHPLCCLLRHCLSTIFMTRIALVCRHWTLRTTPKDPLPQMSGAVVWGDGHGDGCRWKNWVKCIVKFLFEVLITLQSCVPVLMLCIHCMPVVCMIINIFTDL